MGKNHFISYSLDGKAADIEAKLVKDQALIPDILELLAEYGEILEITNEPSAWFSVIFFYLKIKNIVLELQFCDRRFQIIGFKAQTQAEIKQLYFESNEYVILKNFTAGCQLDNIGEYLRGLTFIL